jgi:hypothetical protein
MSKKIKVGKPLVGENVSITKAYILHVTTPDGRNWGVKSIKPLVEWIQDDSDRFYKTLHRILKTNKPWLLMDGFELVEIGEDE